MSGNSHLATQIKNSVICGGITGLLTEQKPTVTQHTGYRHTLMYREYFNNADTYFNAE